MLARSTVTARNSCQRCCGALSGTRPPSTSDRPVATRSCRCVASSGSDSMKPGTSIIKCDAVGAASSARRPASLATLSISGPPSGGAMTSTTCSSPAASMPASGRWGNTVMWAASGARFTSNSELAPSTTWSRTGWSRDILATSETCLLEWLAAVQAPDARSTGVEVVEQGQLLDRGIALERCLVARLLLVEARQGVNHVEVFGTRAVSLSGKFGRVESSLDAVQALQRRAREGARRGDAAVALVDVADAVLYGLLHLGAALPRLGQLRHRV